MRIAGDSVRSSWGFVRGACRGREPWCEPALATLLGSLPDRERVVVLLLHGYEWSMSEAADLLGVSKSTVQTHADRGMARLRAGLGVTL
jgi:DNA-directed RNA polymerase specialized sigma24 family protein